MATRPCSSDVEQCLAPAFPSGIATAEAAVRARAAKKVAAYGLKGAESVWIKDTGTLRFKVGLSDFRRARDGSAHNDFYVEYLKY